VLRTTWKRGTRGLRKRKWIKADNWITVKRITEARGKIGNMWIAEVENKLKWITAKNG
jgi:hypothetical protein